MARRRKQSKSRIPARPLWRGHLKLSLVTCPIALYNAITESEDIHLHMLNPETGNRIHLQTVDAETGDVLDRQDLVRGYEFQKDRYVALMPDELDELRIESSSVMAIEQFVDMSEIDPRYYERSYYIIPDGEAGQDAYSVIRAVMGKARMFAITRAVIARKERVIAMKSCAKGIIGYALREESDIRDADRFFDDVEDGQPDKEMMDIALRLVNQKKARFDPSKFSDRYETRLRQLIDAKLKGVEFEPEEAEEEPQVIDLMEALRKSIRMSGGGAAAGGRGRSATVHRLHPKKKAAARKKAAPKRKKTASR